MTVIRHTRLSKESSDFIKKALKVFFVQNEKEDLSKTTILLIFLSDDHYVIAQDGDMRHWFADDVVKAKRSIKRLNTTCEIYDRRDYIISSSDKKKSNNYNQVITDLILHNSEISSAEAILIVSNLDSEITKLENYVEKLFSERKDTEDKVSRFNDYSSTIDMINFLRKIRYPGKSIEYKKYTKEAFTVCP